MSSSTHFRYSFQYGTSHAGELVKRAGELGKDRLAITDHGGLYGPVDVTFFEDVQGPCAATAFDSWLLLVRG